MIELSVLTGIIIALGEAIKKTGVINKKFIPLINIGLGILVGLLYTAVNGGTLYEGAYNGIVAGLMSSGLYSGVKNVKEELTHYK